MTTKTARSLFSPQLLRHATARSLQAKIGYCTDAVEPLSSAVHRGVHFENRSMTLLEEHLSMSLKRVGGKGDGGIDMLGWWWIPQLSHDASLTHNRRRIRIIAQCKAEKKKIGPKYVRELEGVLHRFHMPSPLSPNDGECLQDFPFVAPQTAPQQHIPSVGLFISESPFTTATILYAQSSSIPLLLLHLPQVDQDPMSPSCESSICTATWNPALAGDQGLLGGHMEIRWERSIHGPDRPGLWWRNVKLPSWAPELTLGHVERDHKTARRRPVTATCSETLT